MEAEIHERLKVHLLETMTEIDRICTKCNIRYFLAYGTLIGAIRHDGFIPWDDDLDIMMPYEDLTKFEKACETELDKERFFYQSQRTENGYDMTISRMRKNGTVLMEKSMQNKNVHCGVFVDIYPIFGAPENKKERKRQIRKAMLYNLYSWGESVKNHGLIMRLGSAVLLKLKSKKGKEKAKKKLFAEISKFPFDESKLVTALDSGMKEISTSYQRSWFGSERHKFENNEFSIPAGYDNILRVYFGNYMELPPPEQRIIHHEFVEIKL